jgi:glutamate-1-semialdehyde 2,1-aminomutase
MVDAGARLSTGLVEAAATVGLQVDVHGFPTMAMVSIEADDWDRYLNHVWSAAMARRGVLVHATLAWYTCAALTPDQIDRVLDVAVDAFADVADEMANPSRARPPSLDEI